MRFLEGSRRVIDGRIAAAEKKRRGDDPCRAFPTWARTIRDRARTSVRRLGTVLAGRGMGAPKVDEGARPVAHGIADHLGQLTRERTLALLRPLGAPGCDSSSTRSYETGRRHDDQIGAIGGESRVNQSGLRRLSTPPL